MDNPIPIYERPALSAANAGLMLDGLSAASVYRLVRAGHLRPIPGRKPIRIARTEIERYAREGAPAAAALGPGAAVIPMHRSAAS